MTTHSSRALVTRIWAGLAVLLVVSAMAGVTAPGAGASGSNTLTVKAGEYVYKLKGALKAGWTQVNFDNAGVEDHMMAVVQLKKGVTTKQLKAAALSSNQSAFEKVAAPDADPNGVPGLPDLLGPGQKTTTLTELTAGHYGILCFVPTPSDGKPHIAHGMVTVFDVSTAKSNLKPPTDGVTDVTLNDGSITFPADNLGRQLNAKVTNEGTTPHTFTLVKLNEGKTLDEANTYFDAFFNGEAPAGDPPGVIAGGITGVAPGGIAYLQQALTAGHYGYLSTGGDAPNDDYAQGMKGEFDVK